MQRMTISNDSLNTSVPWISICATFKIQLGTTCPRRGPRRATLGGGMIRMSGPPSNEHHIICGGLEREENEIPIKPQILANQ